MHTNETSFAKSRAVFLDRDGVLNEPVLNPTTGAYESPHALEDLRLCPDVPKTLRTLSAAGFELFIVTNQPSFAKGKASLETLKAIAVNLESQLITMGVKIREAFYCFHHPEGCVPEFTQRCQCRKPQPYFLQLAAQKHAIDLSRSWMIGDRGSDVECGHRAGCRAILIDHPYAGRYNSTAKPDFVARDLASAAEIILADEPRRAHSTIGVKTA